MEKNENKCITYTQRSVSHSHGRMASFAYHSSAQNIHEELFYYIYTRLCVDRHPDTEKNNNHHHQIATDDVNGRQTVKTTTTTGVEKEMESSLSKIRFRDMRDEMR